MKGKSLVAQLQTRIGKKRNFAIHILKRPKPNGQKSKVTPANARVLTAALGGLDID